MKSFWQRFLGNPRVIMGLGWIGLVVLIVASSPTCSRLAIRLQSSAHLS